MASKDKDTGLWIAQWYEIDVYGNKKRHKKRGFKTMREAKQYEQKMGRFFYLHIFWNSPKTFFKK